MPWPDDYDMDDGKPGGNGGGHRRRRADKPSKVDRAAKKAVEGSGCLLTVVRLVLVGGVLLLVVATASTATAATAEVVGHRGTGWRPENTLAGISNAAYHGADRVEIDVRETGSGTLVALHDDTLDDTTSGTGAVADLPHSYVAACRVHTRAKHAGRAVSRRYDGRYTVPSLSAVVNRANRRGIALLLDVKTGARNPRLLRQVARATVPVAVQVRTAADVAWLSGRLATGVDVGYCCTWPGDAVLEALSDVGASHLSIRRSAVTADRVTAAGEYGLDVHAWGWQAHRDRAQLLGLGVHVHTDWP